MRNIFKKKTFEIKGEITIPLSLKIIIDDKLIHYEKYKKINRKLMNFIKDKDVFSDSENNNYYVMIDNEPLTFCYCNGLWIQEELKNKL